MTDTVPVAHVETWVEEARAYLQMAVGRVYTNDTPDMAITGPVRITLRINLEDAGEGFPSLVEKQDAARELLLYLYEPNDWFNFETTGASGALTGSVLANLSALLGAEHTVGLEFRPGSPETIAIIDTPRASLASFQEPARPPDTAAQLAIGHTNSTGRLYWAQMEEIDRVRFQFPGVNGNHLLVAPSNLELPGDAEWVFRVQTPDWTPSSTGRLIARHNPGASQASFRLSLSSLGGVVLEFSSNGTSTSTTATTAVGAADGAMIWLKCRRTFAGVVSWFRAADSPTEPIAWTAIGTPTSGTAGPIFTGTAPLTIGANMNSAGTSSTSVWNGRIARSIVRNAIGIDKPQLRFPGATVPNNYLSVSAVQSPTEWPTAVEMVARVGLPWNDLTIPTGGIAFWGFGAFRFFTAQMNSFIVAQSQDGVSTTFPGSITSTNDKGFTDGQLVWWRALMEVVPTGIRCLLQFSTADTATEPTTWTTAFDTIDVNSKKIVWGASGPQMWFDGHIPDSWGPRGRLARALVRVDGTTTCDLAETDAKVAGVSSFTSTSGHTVTVHANPPALFTFPGVPGNFLSLPTDPSWQVTGPMTLVLDFTPGTFTGIQVIFSRLQDGSPDWQIYRDGSSLCFNQYLMGGLGYLNAWTGVLPSAVGQRIRVAVTRVVNGANTEARWFTTTDLTSVWWAAVWTPLGTMTSAVGTPVNTAVSPTYVGAQQSNGAYAFQGSVRQAVISSGVNAGNTPGGSRVLDINPDNAAVGAPSFWVWPGFWVTANQTAGNIIVQRDLTRAWNKIVQGTVLDVGEGNARPDDTSFTATTGQTVTEVVTAGKEIITPIADRLTWRFDAEEVPELATVVLLDDLLDSDTDQNGIADGWTAFQSSGQTGTRAMVGGHQRIAASFSASDRSYGIVTDEFPVIGGQEYSAFFNGSSVLTGSSYANCALEFRDAAGTKVGEFENYIGPTRKWYSINWAAPATAVTCVLRVYGDSFGASASFQIDLWEVKLEKAGSSSYTDPRGRTWGLTNPAAITPGVKLHQLTASAVEQRSKIVKATVVAGSDEYDPPHLAPTVGYVTTPDTPDMTIDGDFHVTAKVRSPDYWGKPGIYEVIAQQWGTQWMLYIGDNIVWAALTPLPSGPWYPALSNEPWIADGDDGYVGLAIYPTRGRIAALKSLDGTTWAESHAGATHAPFDIPDSTDLLRVGADGGGFQQWQGRIYWVQMEAINRARLVFPGVVGNYLETPVGSYPGVVTSLEYVARIAPDDWLTDHTGTTLPGIISGAYGGLRLNANVYPPTLQFYESAGPYRHVETTSMPAFAPGQRVWVRGRLTPTEMTVDYSTADTPVEPTTWTTLATLAVTSGFQNVGLDWAIGLDHAWGPVDRVFKGRFLRAIVRVAGTTALDVSENNAGTMLTPDTFKATTGQTVSVVASGPLPHLNALVGTVTTPDPGPLPTRCTFVYRTRGPRTAGSHKTVVGQLESGGAYSWSLGRRQVDGATRWLVSSTGSDLFDHFTGAGVTTTEDVLLAHTINPTTVQSWRHDGTAWAPGGSTPNLAPTLYDSSSVMRVGMLGAAVDPTSVWDDHIYSVELRTGLDPSGLAPAGTKTAFPNLIGHDLRVADAPNLNFTGDMEVVARLSRPPASGEYDSIVSKSLDGWYDGWAFGFHLNGHPVFTFIPVGVSGAVYANCPASPGAAVGDMHWLKMTRVQATGVTTFWWAPDQPVEPSTWTLLGTATNNPGVAMFASASPLVVGNISVNGSWPMNGRIARIIVRSAIGGPAVLDFTESDIPYSNPQPTSFAASTGQTITVHGDPLGDPLPSELLWRFDAAEHPGGGATSYADPRGRIWTLTNPRALVPAVAPIPQPQADKVVWRFDAHDARGPKWLTPTLGTVSTPDPGPLPNECTFVFKVLGPEGPEAYNTIVNQGTAPAYSYSVTRFARSDGFFGWLPSADGGGAPIFAAANPQLPIQDVPEVLAMSVSRPRNEIVSWAHDGVEWRTTSIGSPAAAVPFDTSEALRIGAGSPWSNGPWQGRIYWVELRTGLDPAGGTVLWRFDASDYPGNGTVYADPRGRVWTLTNGSAITPRTATTYTDPRGRVWTFSNSQALAPTFGQPVVAAVEVPAEQPIVASVELLAGLVRV